MSHSEADPATPELNVASLTHEQLLVNDLYVEANTRAALFDTLVSHYALTGDAYAQMNQLTTQITNLQNANAALRAELDAKAGWVDPSTLGDAQAKLSAAVDCVVNVATWDGLIASLRPPVGFTRWTDVVSQIVTPEVAAAASAYSTIPAADRHGPYSTVVGQQTITSTSFAGLSLLLSTAMANMEVQMLGMVTPTDDNVYNPMSTVGYATWRAAYLAIEAQLANIGQTTATSVRATFGDGAGPSVTLPDWPALEYIDSRGVFNTTNGFAHPFVTPITQPSLISCAIYPFASPIPTATAQLGYGSAKTMVRNGPGTSFSLKPTLVDISASGATTGTVAALAANMWIQAVGDMSKGMMVDSETLLGFTVRGQCTLSLDGVTRSLPLAKLFSWSYGRTNGAPARKLWSAKFGTEYQGSPYLGDYYVADGVRYVARGSDTLVTPLSDDMVHIVTVPDRVNYLNASYTSAGTTLLQGVQLFIPALWEPAISRARTVALDLTLWMGVDSLSLTKRMGTRAGGSSNPDLTKTANMRWRSIATKVSVPIPPPPTPS